MPTAYVLISCELGCEHAVIDELCTVSGVQEASQIYGSTFDIIIKIKADTEAGLRDIINRRVRRIEKIKATQTMMVMK